jgi:hypothetical protein
MISVDKSKLDRVALLLPFDTQTHSHVEELIIKDHISNIYVSMSLVSFEWFVILEM